MPPAFVDTNVLIYAYSESEPEKRRIARNLLGGSRLAMSTQIVSEFIWVMTRKYQVALADVRTAVQGFSEVFDMHLIYRQTIQQALDIAARYGLSYWDSLVVASGLEAGCSMLYTEDLQDGQVFEQQLQVRNPFSGVIDLDGREMHPPSAEHS